MPDTKSQPLYEVSWSTLRKRANEMGIPAWQLAENLSFHDRNGELLLFTSENHGAK